MGEIAGGPWWVGLVAALMGGGGWTALQGLWRERRRPPAGIARQQAAVDASLLTVARARDELMEDVTLTRTILREREEAHALERQEWERERVRFRAQIRELEETLTRERREATASYAALEVTLRTERDAAQRRYDDLLTQVRALRRRADEEGIPE